MRLDLRAMERPAPKGQEARNAWILEPPELLAAKIPLQNLDRAALQRLGGRRPFLPCREIEAAPALPRETEQRIVEGDDVRVLEIPLGIPFVGIEEPIADADPECLQRLR